MFGFPKNRRSTLIGALVLAAGITAPLAVSAGQEAGVEVGILTCSTLPESRVNLVVHSSAEIECEFKEADGSVERYTGETGIGVGLDLHVTHKETIVFKVLAKHFEQGSHQLAGRYGGGKAAVTAGHGAGAALLIGGHDDSIGLKPAVAHSEGVGLAAGIGYLVLKPGN